MSPPTAPHHSPPSPGSGPRSPNRRRGSPACPRALRAPTGMPPVRRGAAPASSRPELSCPPDQQIGAPCPAVVSLLFFLSPLPNPGLPLGVQIPPWPPSASPARRSPCRARIRSGAAISGGFSPCRAHPGLPRTGSTPPSPPLATVDQPPPHVFVCVETSERPCRSLQRLAQPLPLACSPRQPPAAWPRLSQGPTTRSAGHLASTDLGSRPAMYM
ncbi:basic proline-rich protein-like [Hordeum vulgare subsp. vulgare]|uniref:basic proline-rich protein-like n=1 Tax=Hordeum vulgare subsp. vulgare TaxID=112509 RepID=UPI001D1A37A0|nr:basic proline-rich protein-like [Hordeum vulgare subsp. vulgare]